MHIPLNAGSTPKSTKPHSRRRTTAVGECQERTMHHHHAANAARQG